MVDYYPVLERAVAALNPNTKESREALYGRARRAMVDGLRKSDPSLSDTDLGKQTAALEEAIRRLEVKLEPGAEQDEAAASSAVEPPSAASESAAPTVAPPLAPKVPPLPTGRAAPSITPPVRGAAPVAAAGAASAASAAPALAVEPRHAPISGMPDEGYEDRPPLDDEEGRPWALIAASVAGIVLVVAGVAAWSFWPSKAPRIAATKPAATTTPASPGAQQAQRGTPVRRAEPDSGAAPYVYLRQPVYYRTTHPVGTIVVDKQQSFLYVVRPSVSALRYGIGVGPDCVTAAGLYQIVRKEEWPGLKTASKAVTDEERSKNPLGARAMYLNNEGRIHGTNTPSSIGRPGSLGCFRLTNDDVVHLYERSPLETRVVVLN